MKNPRADGELADVVTNVALLVLCVKHPVTMVIMYLTYLQENFKPVVYRSASVEVFDEEDAQVVHPGPSYWGCQGT